MGPWGDDNRTLASSSAGLPPAPASPSPPPLSVADYAKVIQIMERFEDARQEMYALRQTVATVLGQISDAMTELQEDLEQLLLRDDDDGDGAPATTADD